MLDKESHKQKPKVSFSIKPDHVNVFYADSRLVLSSSLPTTVLIFDNEDTEYLVLLELGTFLEFQLPRKPPVLTEKFSLYNMKCSMIRWVDFCV